MSDYKEYIGAIEFPLDDALYEIGLRELRAGDFLGTWECTACRICGVAKEARNG